MATDARNSAWIGGAMLAQGADAKLYSVTKAEYEEEALQCLRGKSRVYGVANLRRFLTPRARYLSTHLRALYDPVTPACALLHSRVPAPTGNEALRPSPAAPRSSGPGLGAITPRTPATMALHPSSTAPRSGGSCLATVPPISPQPTFDRPTPANSDFIVTKEKRQQLREEATEREQGSCP